MSTKNEDTQTQDQGKDKTKKQTLAQLQKPLPKENMATIHKTNKTTSNGPSKDIDKEKETNQKKSTEDDEDEYLPEEYNEDDWDENEESFDDDNSSHGSEENSHHPAPQDDNLKPFQDVQKTLHITNLPRKITVRDIKVILMLYVDHQKYQGKSYKELTVPIRLFSNDTRFKWSYAFIAMESKEDVDFAIKKLNGLKLQRKPSDIPESWNGEYKYSRSDSQMYVLMAARAQEGYNPPNVNKYYTTLEKSKDKKNTTAVYKDSIRKPNVSYAAVIAAKPSEAKTESPCRSDSADEVGESKEKSNDKKTTPVDTSNQPTKKKNDGHHKTTHHSEDKDGESLHSSDSADFANESSRHPTKRNDTGKVNRNHSKRDADEPKTNIEPSTTVSDHLAKQDDVLRHDVGDKKKKKTDYLGAIVFPRPDGGMFHYQSEPAASDGSLAIYGYYPGNIDTYVLHQGYGVPIPVGVPISANSGIYSPSNEERDAFRFKQENNQTTERSHTPSSVTIHRTAATASMEPVSLGNIPQSLPFTTESRSNTLRTGDIAFVGPNNAKENNPNLVHHGNGTHLSSMQTNSLPPSNFSLVEHNNESASSKRDGESTFGSGNIEKEWTLKCEVIVIECKKNKNMARSLDNGNGLGGEARKHNLAPTTTIFSDCIFSEKNKNTYNSKKEFFDKLNTTREIFYQILMSSSILDEIQKSGDFFSSSHSSKRDDIFYYVKYSQILCDSDGVPHDHVPSVSLSNFISKKNAEFLKLI